jgi:hypothetical protein
LFRTSSVTSSPFSTKPSLTIIISHALDKW